MSYYRDEELLTKMDKIDSKRKQLLVTLSDLKTKFLESNEIRKYEWLDSLSKILLDKFSVECTFIRDVLKYNDEEFEDYYNVEEHMNEDINNWIHRLAAEGNEGDEFITFVNHVKFMSE